MSKFCSLKSKMIASDYKRALTSARDLTQVRSQLTRLDNTRAAAVAQRVKVRQILTRRVSVAIRVAETPLGHSSKLVDTPLPFYRYMTASPLELFLYSTHLFLPALFSSSSIPNFDVLFPRVRNLVSFQASLNIRFLFFYTQMLFSNFVLSYETAKCHHVDFKFLFTYKYFTFFVFPFHDLFFFSLFFLSILFRQFVVDPACYKSYYYGVPLS